MMESEVEAICGGKLPQDHCSKRRYHLLHNVFVVALAAALVAASAVLALRVVREQDTSNNNNTEFSNEIQRKLSENNCTCTCPPEEEDVRSVTMIELRQHTTPGDCWVAFYDQVYDLTEYAPTHNGSAASPSLIYELCGQDGTLDFEVFHSPIQMTLVEEYRVGDLVKEEEEEDESTTATTTQMPSTMTTQNGERIHLPAPSTSGGLPLTDALAQRYSVRSYHSSPLTLAEISQLLWAAQGETHDGDKRTAPSAGALYPLEIYLVVATRVYRYRPFGHYLDLVLLNNERADLKADLAEAALSQEFVGEAPAVFVVAGVYERTAQKYGNVRAERYVQMEAGHAAQNLLLQAVAIGMGGTPVGAFRDDQVQNVLNFPLHHKPLYVIPIGRPD